MTRDILEKFVLMWNVWVEEIVLAMAFVLREVIASVRKDIMVPVAKILTSLQNAPITVLPLSFYLLHILVFCGFSRNTSKFGIIVSQYCFFGQAIPMREEIVFAIFGSLVQTARSLSV